VRLIPFTQRFEGSQADPQLPEKLREELPGIFAWMVQGCLEWQEHGIGEPESILAATQEYREEMDTLASFLQDCCVIREDLMTPATTLFGEYKDWAWKAGEKQETKKSFGMLLKERGFQNKKISAGKHKGRMGWLGIGLRVEHPDPEDHDDNPTNGTKTAEDTPPEEAPREDTPPEENPHFEGKSSGEAPESGGSGTKNQNLQPETPSRVHGFGKSSTSSTSSTNAPPPTKRGLTEEEARQVRKLINEGVEPEIARAAVVGNEEESSSNYDWGEPF
jgi:phage/plasmid-associated DNA primase